MFFNEPSASAESPPPVTMGLLNRGARVCFLLHMAARDPITARVTGSMFSTSSHFPKDSTTHFKDHQIPINPFIFCRYTAFKVETGAIEFLTTEPKKFN